MTKLSAVIRALTGIVVLGGAVVAGTAPAMASPDPAQIARAQQEPAGCAIESAELTWGVKESFRSYISGSIANGEWTVSDDMRYETPDFIWDRAEGSVSGSLEEGRIAFTGAVHFTGHDGAMQLDLSDPAIEFSGENEAYLVLGIGATDAANEGGAAATAEVRAAEIDLSGALSAEGDTLEIAAAPVRLTEKGAEAFNGGYGGYVAGDELDPISLSATVAGCALAEIEAGGGSPDESSEPTDQGTLPVEPREADPGIPWAPIIVAGVALLAIGVASGLLIAGRRGRSQPESDPERGSDPPSAPERGSAPPSAPDA
ncbi:HtaA domain-containing protein [Leucobacter tenebrionis]|uniref:HtaA domain-containing protein n=1 Tax=Leucobacter tenebrionis TaxID=2873270 RepID=UPI001CA767A0|nr:HtaA domain-containing protein [Leucobacter tenebrionis]QZY52969.1 HtaA domain-containing protein [Leucobacter tenebrionis]